MILSKLCSINSKENYYTKIYNTNYSSFTIGNTTYTDSTIVAALNNREIMYLKEDNSYWLKVEWQNWGFTSKAAFNSSTAVLYYNKSDEFKYSILTILSNPTFKVLDNKYEFYWQYPSHSTTEYCRWKLNDNPCQLAAGSTITGLEVVHADWVLAASAGFGGLARSGDSTSCYLDGALGASSGNWVMAIASYTNYTGARTIDGYSQGIPGPLYSSGTWYNSITTKLWVRILKNTIKGNI